jgi:hypothetical protein
VLLLASCEQSPFETAQEKRRLVEFRADRPVQQLAVAGPGWAYQVPIFSTQPIEDIQTDSLNVYLMPPPARYVFDRERQTFGYWNHYDVHPTSSSVEDLAARFEQPSEPFVVVALPGTYGSDGPRSLQHEARIIDVMDAALTQLREITGARVLNVAGQSTTAAIGAGLLTRRSDLRCVALSSGPYDYPDFVRERHWPSMYSGATTPFSAVAMANAIKTDPERKVALIADRQDSRVPFRYSEAMRDAMVREGHEVELLSLNSADPEHHALQLGAVRWMLDCVRADKAGR